MLSLATAPLVLAGLWMTFQHKPGWYRPIELDDAGMRRVRAEATGVVDHVSDKIAQALPFDLVLDDRSVSEWLATLAALSPEMADRIPKAMSRPAIRFDDGQMRMGVLVDADGWQAILGVCVTLRVSQDGRSIHIALTRIQGGSLPVPRAILARLFDRILPYARQRWAGEEDEGTAARYIRDVRSVDDLFESVEVRNRFVWPNGDRPFRIDSIEMDDGELRLRIEPL